MPSLFLSSSTSSKFSRASHASPIHQPSLSTSISSFPNTSPTFSFQKNPLQEPALQALIYPPSEMQLLKAFSIMPLFLLPFASCTPSPTNLAPSSSAVAKPGLTKVFTGNLQLEKALKPIAIPGGVRLGKFTSFIFESGRLKRLTQTGTQSSPSRQVVPSRGLGLPGTSLAGRLSPCSMKV